MTEMLEFGQWDRCPKCGYSNASTRVRYIGSYEGCSCSDSLESLAHLEYECYQCDFTRPMKPKDASDIVIPSKIGDYVIREGTRAGDVP